MQVCKPAKVTRNSLKHAFPTYSLLYSCNKLSIIFKGKYLHRIGLLFLCLYKRPCVHNSVPFVAPSFKHMPVVKELFIFYSFVIATRDKSITIPVVMMTVLLLSGRSLNPSNQAHVTMETRVPLM